MAFLIPLSMSDKKYKFVERFIYDSYSRACILYIDEIYNDKLLAGFEQRKKDLANELKLDSCKTKTLFHGTRKDNIEPIYMNGFDPEKNKRAGFGPGTYFADNIAISLQYTDIDKDQISYAFVAEAISERIIQWNYKVQLIHNDKEVVDKNTYDISVDNLKHTNEYVVPHKYGVIPKYIVAFHKSAK
jgi:hypothetical protein